MGELENLADMYIRARDFALFYLLDDASAGRNQIRSARNYALY
jgi:hypothetical protein